MKPTEFFNGTKLNTLNRTYKGLIDANHVFVLKHTSFHSIDRLESGRNGVSKVVQLLTETIKANEVYFESSSKFSPTLYINASTRSTHGFGSQDKQVLFVYRINGKKLSCIINHPWDDKDFEASDRIYYAIDTKFPNKIKNRPYDIRRAWQLKLKKHLRDTFYYNFSTLERGACPDKLTKLLNFYGVTVVKVVPFTHRFSMSGTKYVKLTKNKGFEIGQKQAATYNTLPSKLELVIQKTPIKTVGLKELGVEESGYYSHDDRMCILPNQIKLVKQFKRNFETKLQKNGG